MALRGYSIFHCSNSVCLLSFSVCFLPLIRSFFPNCVFQDFSNDDTKLEYNVDADNGIAMEGYLFKRASNAFKTWNRYDM